jgi:transcriptional regulator with XRE-family HTH domain
VERQPRRPKVQLRIGVVPPQPLKLLDRETLSDRITAMSTAATLVRQARFNAGVSLRDFAERLETSAATLCDYEQGRKEPRLSTLERIAERSEMELHVELVPKLSGPERLSLELHRRVAARLQEDPGRVLGMARKNLERLLESSVAEHGMPYLMRWNEILRMPVESICEILVSTDQPVRDLRSISPFAGVLSNAERLEVLEQYGPAAERRRACAGTSSST